MKLPRWLRQEAEAVERDALARAQETGELAFPQPALSTVILYPMTTRQIILYDLSGPPPALTGATQRLTRCCTVCGDELPPDASFCVECGRAVSDMVFE